MSTVTAPKTIEYRDELIQKSREIAEKAKGESRDLTADEASTIDGNLTEVKSINEHLAKAAESRRLMGQLDAMAAHSDINGQKSPEGEATARTLGEHFIKHVHPNLIESKGQSGVTFTAPEFRVKAATDTHQVAGWTAGVPYLTDYDRTVQRAFRVRLTVADLLAQGTIQGNAISYLVEAGQDGDFATVAEGAAKPQMFFPNPTQVTDALKKLAGFIKLTDEFVEDADFLKSEIDTRLLYRLAYFEEQQLLNGNGSGQNLTGLLNRSGIQTEASSGPTDSADSLFRAIGKVQNNSGLEPDGIIINPADYEKLRLTRDGNGQYYGGGFFAGQYGTNGMPMQPPLWGYRTVVTPAIASGTALVGSFGMSSTMYRKGGVRVEVATQHASDFTNNLLTIRAEERVALAVRVPLGLCKVTFDYTP